LCWRILCNVNWTVSIFHPLHKNWKIWEEISLIFPSDIFCLWVITNSLRSVILTGRKELSRDSNICLAKVCKNTCQFLKPENTFCYPLIQNIFWNTAVRNVKFCVFVLKLVINLAGNILCWYVKQWNVEVCYWEIWAKGEILLHKLWWPRFKENRLLGIFSKFFHSLAFLPNI